MAIAALRLLGLGAPSFPLAVPSAAVVNPGNLGTLLRSALAFGWHGVFLLYGCCDPFNEKELRASGGASFQLPIVFDYLAETPLCLKLGSEGSGLSEKSRQECELVHSIIIGSYEFFAHEVESQPVWLVSADDLNHGKRYKL
ncbi:hypothetical protein M9H77_19091 [Catharanthus roseus]|uniref:Uncharacterized protein n=1 Tax=Catharanthus roseus TaxID=4058 RepID=A0ACC0B9E3_CATRO|nr:hypothetical protein M9H77_19091 [Catharanthus roseus]